MKIFGFTLKSLVPGIIASLAVAGVGAVVVLGLALGGALNLSANWADPRLVYYTLHTTFKNSVRWRAPDTVPGDLDDEGRILLGAQHYANACAKCHGGPGLGQNPQALAMRPRPQHLAAVVDQFEDGELHYILDKGVRMSAMPAWPTVGREDEIWNVVAFIRQLPDMTADEYLALMQDRDLPGDADLPYGERGPLIDNGIDATFEWQERWPEEEYAYASPSTEWHDFAIKGDVVQRCAACHGAEGAGDATNGRAPNLTVLPASYISNALEEYASGERKSGIMQIVASNLSAQQRIGLGDYYASLEDAPSIASSDVDMALGQEIATSGKPLSAVPSCVTCHNNGDVDGDTVAGMVVPNLAGQSPVYIEDQLRLFAAGIREGGSEWKPMGYIASNLTGEEIASLAAYFAAQEPGAAIERTDLLASADLSAGEGVVTRVCSECHSQTGIGSQSGDTPNLSLQSSDYLHQQLVKFRNDVRPNSQMSQTAKQISAEDIANVAAYFGSVEPIAVSRDVDAELVAAGAPVAQYGLEEQNVPACLTCHASAEVDEIRILPRLQGQNFAYLNERLDQFAGESGEDLYALSPMHRIATRMTGDQREAVAAWFSAQAPLSKP